jgi:hypothetical protein
MPKFGFFIQDVLPWQSDDGSDKHPGESIGCELALRRTKQGDGEVYIKAMVAGGPAALSGKLAIGDAIAEINGTDPLDDSSGSVQSLGKLTGGEKGTPVWLKIKGKGNEHVALLRQGQLALKPAPASGTTAGLGFTFQDSKTKEGVDVKVTEIKAAGAFWLASQGGDAPIVVGDIITHVDGKPATGQATQFKGSPFSRILLAGRRGEDGVAFECNIVRMITLPANSIAQVEEYSVAVACLPPAPPSDRVNGNAEIQMMAAPLINGIDVKAAAKVRGAPLERTVAMIYHAVIAPSCASLCPLVCILYYADMTTSNADCDRRIHFGRNSGNYSRRGAALLGLQHRLAQVTWSEPNVADGETFETLTNVNYG